MKVVSYSYIMGGHLQHLYVDVGFDRSLFPQKIKSIIGSRSGTTSSMSVIKSFGPKGMAWFMKNGYLDPCRFLKESECVL